MEARERGTEERLEQWEGQGKRKVVDRRGEGGRSEGKREKREEGMEVREREDCALEYFERIKKVHCYGLYFFPI